MMLSPIKDKHEYEYFIIISILKYMILFFSIFLTFFIFNNTKYNEGFKLMFVIPLIFGLYFYLSNLKKYFLNNIPMTFFIIVLIAKYLITPFVMASANDFSAMANGATTSILQQQLGTILMIYELICIVFAIEICIKVLQKKKVNCIKEVKKEPSNHPNTILVISIIIGILGLFIFPQILQDFNFIFVKEDINVDSRNTIIMIFSYFAEYIQVFLFIILVKYFFYKKSVNHKSSIVFLLLAALLNITLMWTANRMNIFIVAGTTLSILLYYFPERKKTFFISILSLSVIMVVLLSSYRLFGTVGGQVSSDFGDYFKFDKLAMTLQTYFAGPDSVAGAIGTKDLFGGKIDFKTFLNDSFGAVPFVQQLPVFLNDRGNSTFLLFNLFSANGYNPGFIIPMIGQGYIYFGFLFSPIFSILSVVILLFTIYKANRTKDIALKYVLIYLAFNFALFPMYNYTLLMQNFFGRFLPLFLIIWLNKYIYFKKSIKKK